MKPKLPSAYEVRRRLFLKQLRDIQGKAELEAVNNHSNLEEQARIFAARIAIRANDPDNPNLAPIEIMSK